MSFMSKFSLLVMLRKSFVTGLDVIIEQQRASIICVRIKACHDSKMIQKNIEGCNAAR